MPNRLAVRPQSYLQILKHSIDIYRHSFRHVFWVALLISVIVFIPRLIVTFIDPNYFNNIAVLSPDKLWFFLIEILSAFFFIVLLWRMYSVLVGVNDKVREDLQIAFKKIWLIIAAALLQFAIFMLTALIIYFFYYYFFQGLFATNNSSYATIALTGLSLYVFIEVYLIFLFIFYLLLIVIENKGIIAALKKSAQLVWGNWWQNFWILMTPLLCYMIFLMIVRYIFRIDLPIYFIDSSPSSKIIPILYMLLFSLFLPWNAAILIVQMQDLELRKKL